MAAKLIKRGRIYFGSKLVAECTTGTVRRMTNSEQGHGNDGSEYYSQGNPTSEIDFDTVKPAIGYSAAVEDAITNQTIVDMTGVIGDKVYAFTGIFQSDEHKFESKSGMLTGAFKFIGGPARPV